MEGWFSQYCYKKKKTADKGCISKHLKRPQLYSLIQCVCQPWAGSLTPHCSCPHLHLALGLVIWAGTSQELLQQWHIHCQYLWWGPPWERTEFTLTWVTSWYGGEGKEGEVERRWRISNCCCLLPACLIHNLSISAPMAVNFCFIFASSVINVISVAPSSQNKYTKRNPGTWSHGTKFVPHGTVFHNLIHKGNGVLHFMSVTLMNLQLGVRQVCGSLLLEINSIHT